MKSKIISITPIATFSIPSSSMAISNKEHRKHNIIKALGITAISILILVGVAGASPFAYITNYDSNNISVIDTTTNKVIDTVNVGSFPLGVAVNPDGKRVYVTNSGGDSTNFTGTISVIDTTTNTVAITINVGNNSLGVAVNPDGTKLYVVNSNIYPDVEGNISVIDTATNNVTSTISVGSFPRGVAVSPDGKKVYVTIQNPGINSLTGIVSVIDTATNKVTATVNVGSAPSGVAVTPDGNEVYVVNYASNSVSVIDTATNKVTATVPVGKYPLAVGQFRGSVTKSNSTMGSSSTPFVNPINQTDNKTNNTGMTTNTGTVGKQERESNSTQKSKSTPFISSFWVLVAMLGAVMYVRKMK